MTLSLTVHQLPGYHLQPGSMLHKTLYHTASPSHIRSNFEGSVLVALTSAECDEHHFLHNLSLRSNLPVYA